MAADPVHLDQVRFLALLELGLLANGICPWLWLRPSLLGYMRIRSASICGQTAIVNHHEAGERYREDYDPNDPRLNALAVTAARLLVVTIRSRRQRGRVRRCLCWR